jgi:hypothetical protein
MLTQITTEKEVPGRNPRRERRLWYEGTLPMHSLGCASCPEVSICGGLLVKAPMFDCTGFCCGHPETCDKVCRQHPDYADRIREIGTFALDTVPRAEALISPPLPTTVPMIFHRSRRTQAARLPVAALPLSRMFNRRDGSPRHLSHADLCCAYSIESGSLLVLSGTDHDAPIERWWGFGEKRRRELIRNLLSIGVAFTTTPNYSLFIDTPRWDDMHAMKRIALVHQEFLSEGLPAALHVNGRTETDFRRWSEYVAARPEVTHLAYEFTTGTGWAGRQEQHAEWLCKLAGSVARPLTLVLRGGMEVLPTLAAAFAGVTLLDTSSFMKAMMRKRAVLNGNLGWCSAPTGIGAPVDEILDHNVHAVQAWIEKLAYPNSFQVKH